MKGDKDSSNDEEGKIKSNRTKGQRNETSKPNKKVLDKEGGDDGEKKTSKTAGEKLASKDKKKADQDNKKGVSEDVKDNIIVGEEEKLSGEKTELKPVLLPCGSCYEISKRWPPPPYVDPNPRDPSLLYPGDEDPEFFPVNGDVVIIHPGLTMGLMDLKRNLPEGGFIWSYDETQGFRFALGDLIVRIGTYDEQTPPEPEGTQTRKASPRRGDKALSGKGENSLKKKNLDGKKLKAAEDKNMEDSNSKTASGKKKPAGGIKNEAVDKAVMEEKPSERYHPYAKLELYTCSGFTTLEEQAQMDQQKLQEEQALKEQAENDARKRKKGPKGKNNDKVKLKEDEKDMKKKSDKAANSKNAVGNITAIDGVNKNSAPGDITKGTDNNNFSAVEELQLPTAVSDNLGNTSEGKMESAMEVLLKPKWRYLGGQMQLDSRSQSLLNNQCRGLTYFYRRYSMPGTKVDLHSLTPLLGDVLINLSWLNNWYRNLEKWQKEENKYKSLVAWYKPQDPCRGEVVPGTILIRPLVGRELGDWPGWGLDGRQVASNLGAVPPPPLPKSDGDSPSEEPQGSNQKTVSVREAPLFKCDCHRKFPCPKPPCPCHLSDPCPRKENCICIYCNPLPKKPKTTPTEDSDDANTTEVTNTNKKDKKLKLNDKNTQNKGKGATVKARKDEKEDGKGKRSKDKETAGKSKGSDDKTSAKGKKDGKPTKALKGRNENAKEATDDPKGPSQEDVPSKPYSWGMVEMYILHSREEGWEFWGRCKRVCDAAPPIAPSGVQSKPKYFHPDDKLQEVEIKASNKDEFNIETEIKPASKEVEFTKENVAGKIDSGVKKKTE